MKTFEEAFLDKYPKCGYVLRRMNEYQSTPKWGDFTRPYLAGLSRHFRSVMSDSSARVALSYVKAVLGEYGEDIKLPTNKFRDVLTVRDIRSSETWLTENELEELKAETDAQQRVLNDFLIGANTGARYSDFKKLNELNVVKGLLIYTSEKSGRKATVPVKPLVRKLLKEPRSGVTKQVFNRTIKDIAKNSGITEEVKLFKAGKEISGEKWEFISSHTARRSFATNLYLRGVDIVSIGKMMGHSSVEMTKRYIVCGLRELPAQAIEFFK